MDHDFPKKEIRKRSRGSRSSNNKQQGRSRPTPIIIIKVRERQAYSSSEAYADHSNPPCKALSNLLSSPDQKSKNRSSRSWGQVNLLQRQSQRELPVANFLFKISLALALASALTDTSDDLASFLYITSWLLRLHTPSFLQSQRWRCHSRPSVTYLFTYPRCCSILPVLCAP